MLPIAILNREKSGMQFSLYRHFVLQSSLHLCLWWIVITVFPTNLIRNFSVEFVSEREAHQDWDVGLL